MSKVNFFSGSAPVVPDPINFFTEVPVDVEWLMWGDTAFTFDEINQNDLVTFAEFT